MTNRVGRDKMAEVARLEKAIWQFQHTALAQNITQDFFDKVNQRVAHNESLSTFYKKMMKQVEIDMQYIQGLLDVAASISNTQSSSSTRPYLVDRLFLAFVEYITGKTEKNPLATITKVPLDRIQLTIHPFYFPLNNNLPQNGHKMAPQIHRCGRCFNDVFGLPFCEMCKQLRVNPNFVEHLKQKLHPDEELNRQYTELMSSGRYNKLTEHLNNVAHYCDVTKWLQIMPELYGYHITVDMIKSAFANCLDTLQPILRPQIQRLYPGDLTILEGNISRFKQIRGLFGRGGTWRQNLPTGATAHIEDFLLDNIDQDMKNVIAPLFHVRPILFESLPPLTQEIPKSEHCYWCRTYVINR